MRWPRERRIRRSIVVWRGKKSVLEGDLVRGGGSSRSKKNLGQKVSFGGYILQEEGGILRKNNAAWAGGEWKMYL